MSEKVSRKYFKTITLVKRWIHHTDSGGYSRLRKEISRSKIIYPKNDGIFIPNKIWYRLMPSSKHINGGYNFNDMLAELQVFYETSLHRYSLVHSLYAEDQLNLLLKHRKYLKSALVGTFHLPPESTYMTRIINNNQVKRFQHLDAAIVVTRSLIRVCEDWVGKGKVRFIPLGIDTGVFTPETKSKNRKEQDPLKVIIVGSHGRDWDVINKVLSACNEKNVNINFSIVTRLHVRALLDKHPKVKLFSDISEPDLIDLYRKADVLFIPVTFATANNSLLESLACGTPSISTNIGGITDYMDDEAGWILPVGDDRAAYNLLIDLANNRTLIREKEKAARRKAESFDWEIVTNQMLDFYSEVENMYKAERVK